MISLYLPTGVRGGVPEQVHRLATEYVRRGHQVTVYAMDPAPANALYSVKNPSFSQRMQRQLASLRGLGIFYFPPTLASENFSEYDVIHAHGDSHFIRTKRPIVRTFHSSGLDEAVHAASFRRIAGLLSIYPFEYVSGFKAHRRVFVSRAVRSYFPGLSGEIIPNTVDLTQYVPSGVKTENPSILFVAGTLGGRKRGKFLLDLFENVIRPQLPLCELHMVCSEEVAQPGVRWHGNVSAEKLISLYQSSWLTCMPSSHENFGVPLIESMACGTPVVASLNAGSREVLENGRWGVLASDPELGGALVALLNDPVRRENWSALGIQRAEHYALPKIAGAYLALFDELTSIPKKAAA